ncbi:MAG: ABC transporter ATP-binding protein [Bacteroidetes bacterium]|nr:ABC transporter ATP-binding protein [Bacteroidota bacterium]
MEIRKSEIVIKAENLGKKYVIGHQTERGGYTALRDVLMQNTRTLWNKTKDLATGKPIIQGDTIEEVRALKDVSFEIRCGETVGIIGRNGAGKSTLLKILSRITEPSTGRVTIKGRVASLLEVGTGFHPELSGRENIYLNGTILGMTRKEIRSKFEEIVDFAEVRKYLDTPVKRYSSGMYVRLGFAVAAHLEPEILVVDEVLAVGDVQFQKKCLGKMSDVAREGRTVLFVSHNMAAVENLCRTGIVLDNGNIGFNGPITEALKFYLSSITEIIDNSNIGARSDRKGEGQVRITNITIKDQERNENIPFQTGTKFFFEIDYKAGENVKNPRVIIGLYDLMNVGVARFDTAITGDLQSVLPLSGRIICSTESLPLAPGRYFINIAFLSNGVIQDYLAGAVYMDIIGSDYFNTGKTFNESDLKLTKILIKHAWSVS